MNISDHYDESSSGYSNPTTGTLQNFFDNNYYYDINMGQRTIEASQYIGFKGNFNNDNGQINSSNDWSSSQLNTGDPAPITHVVVFKDGEQIAGIVPQQNPAAAFTYSPQYPDVDGTVTLDASDTNDKNNLTISQIKGVVNSVISSGAAGCMIWCLRSRTEYGGFYFHVDFNNTSDALQYPGFAEGMDSVDEREMFNILREGAFRMRGMAEPLEEVPPAPVLLPISSPGEINWQGSAGAYYYIVQRHSGSTGTWVTLASEVSDAGGVDYNGKQVAVLPLYSDDPGSGRWSYRIIAVNGTGESDPSNIVTIS